MEKGIFAFWVVTAVCIVVLGGWHQHSGPASQEVTDIGSQDTAEIKVDIHQCKPFLEKTLDLVFNILPSIYPREGQLVEEPISAGFLSDYANALESASKRASTNTVFVSIIDEESKDLGINFYLNCIDAFKIQNYVLVGINSGTCDALKEKDIDCVTFAKHGTQASIAILQKDNFNIKTELILGAMKLGYSVLYSDIDVYCYKNPLDHISCDRETCDLSAMHDESIGYNTSFMYVHPSEPSQVLFSLIREFSKDPTIDDRDTMSRAIQCTSNKIRTQKLNRKLFRYGNGVSELSDYSKPCSGCILMYNSWVENPETRVFRAKASGQWMLDTDEYYSSTRRKYLKYDNPVFGSDIFTMQAKALRNALAIGQLLNRIVILPRFNCFSYSDSYFKTQPHQWHCPLNAHFRIADFDQQFRPLYREHSFLEHPLVPAEVKEDTSDTYLIASQYALDKMSYVLKHMSWNKNLVMVKPQHKRKGLTDEEVLKYFGNSKSKILVFHHLYDAFSEFLDSEANSTFTKKAARGIIPVRSVGVTMLKS